jgi:RecB family exonuclease
LNALLSNLADACRKYRFTPKFLVVDSYRSGHQLLEALAQNGEPWLNLTPVTPLDLAFKITKKNFTDQGFELVSDGQVLFLIDEILEEMDSCGELTYFSELEGTEGLAGVLKGPLMELRMTGVLSGDIDPGDFVDEQKGREIKALLEKYEKKPLEQKLADAAALYDEALKMLGQDKTHGKETLYLIPEHLELDYLSFAFLDRLTRGCRMILPAEDVRGLPEPGGFYFRAEDRPEKSSPFSWLFDVENAPSSPGETEIFQAYGPACEVKEVFRRLKKENIPADKAVLCYTSAETYLPLILTISSACGIPVTFAEGVPAGFSRPGRLLFGLLAWLEENYAVPVLYRLFTAGDFKVPSEITLARLLRRAGIGWGRERYLGCLEDLEKGLQMQAKEAEAEEQEGLCAYLLNLREQALKLKEIISFLLEKIPPEDTGGVVDFNHLCSGLIDIIKEYARDVSNRDRTAKETLLEVLQETSRSCRGELPLRPALKRLKTQLGAVNVEPSGYEPGRLLATSLRRGAWAFRPFTFVVGLDSGSFPGSSLQDPVLLDRERAKISPNLVPVSTSPERNIHRLNRFLASCRGKITLSFPSFDPVEGRVSFPASALLQAYRLKAGNPGADYSAFMNSLANPSAYFAEERLDSLSEEEWWASGVLHGNKSGELQSVRACYPGLHAGLLAEEARDGELFTQFDGMVPVDPAAVDPRRNPARTMSATGVERLATCPYAYFLRHILKVEPPEEQAFDPGKWLDPLSRGLLLHRIYTDYLRKTCSKASRPGVDRDLLLEVAEELMVDVETSIPPPSSVVYEYEKTDILRGLEVFLRAEEELQQDGSIPLYLEVPFGLGPEDLEKCGQGLEDPVQLALPDGSRIRLRGRIDRIDRTSRKGSYRVWDFKTGSTYGFDEGEYIKQGRQIQHVLYALAAEEILRREDPEARVEEAGYLFPTEKGEGQRFARQRDRRQEALEALQKMLDLLSAGTFCAAGDSDRCSYCDYQPVCRYPQSVERIRRKLSCQDNTELELWKELQEYD